MWLLIATIDVCGCRLLGIVFLGLCLESWKVGLLRLRLGVLESCISLTIFFDIVWKSMDPKKANIRIT